MQGRGGEHKLPAVPLKFDLLTLELFIAVVEVQSIAAAADRANLAASAISRRLSDLEASLGVELFKRHSRGIELTDAGSLLLRHARTVHGQIALMEGELLGFARGDRGMVRLAANKSAIMGGLPRELARFLEIYPLIRVDLDEGISPWIIQAVANSAADLGIFGANVPASGLQVAHYRNNRLVAVVPQGHALASQTLVCFAELLEHDFVCLEMGSSTDTLCRRAAEAMGREIRVRVRIGSFEGQLRMVESGLGIGIVPHHVFEGQARRPGLVSIALDEAWQDRPLNVCFREVDGLSVPARRLLAFLTEPSRAATAACPMGALPIPDASS